MLTILTILTKNIDQKNFTFPRNYEGGAEGGGPDAFVVKDYKKGLFLTLPLFDFVFTSFDFHFLFCCIFFLSPVDQLWLDNEPWRIRNCCQNKFQ